MESTALYDRIIGAGTAALDGTLKTITSGAYSAGDTLSGVIQTAAGVTGAFSLLDTQITPTLSWRPAVNGNNLDLVASRVYNNDRLRAYLNPNQKSVAAMMQSAASSAGGDLDAVMSEIDAMTTYGGVAGAYSEISPEKLSGMAALSLANAQIELQNLQKEMMELRRQSDNSVLLTYNGEDWGRFNTAGQQSEGYDFFVSGGGTFADQDATQNQPGYTYNGGGITAGLDYRISDTTIGGYYGGYTRTGSNIGGTGGKINVNSISCGVFGIHTAGDFYLDIAFSTAWNFYDATRNIRFGTVDRKAKSDTWGRQFNSLAGAGYEFHYGNLVTGPTSTLQYSKAWIDGFAEKDADSLNLRISRQQTDSLQTGLGWGVEYELEIGKKKILPQLFASYQHEFLNDARLIEAGLAQGSDTFETETDGPTRNFSLIGAGLSAQLTDKIAANLNYRTKVGQRKYSAHTLEGSVRVSF